MEDKNMPNGYELLKQQTEAVERFIFLTYLRGIKRGEENIDDVIRHYEEMTPPHSFKESES